MDIETFLLCDAATDSAGKLNILGAFDSIIATSMPAVHPQCSVAFRIRFARSEAGEHKVKISIVDEDGQPLVSDLETAVNIAFRGPETSLAANLIMNLQRLQFKKLGEYSINAAVDGRHEKAIPLTIRVRQQKIN